MARIKRHSALLLLILSLTFARAASPPNSPDWTEPFPPHHIAGNIYYVGTRGLVSFLITTPEGHILISSDLESTVPIIRDNVAKLGFHFSDVTISLMIGTVLSRSLLMRMWPSGVVIRKDTSPRV